VAALESVLWSEDAVTSSKEGSQLEARVRGDLSAADHSLGGSLGWGHTRERERRIRVGWHEEGVAVPRFPLIRPLLLNLLDEIGVEHLNILIDEWSALDPTGATAIQPEFAELLKRTFAGTPHISVKIATNRYQSRFSNHAAGGQYRGLEMGADFFEAVNLDRSLLDEEDLIRFYGRVLFKRLLVCEPGLEVFDPRGTGQPVDQFLLSIFHDGRAFRELVRGSEGIPRRFLLTFNALSQACSHSLHRLWDSSFVQHRIREISLEEESDVGYHSEASQLLSHQVKNIVTSTGSRAFLVQREDREILESAVEELLEKRLVHEYPRSKLPPDVRDEYDCYLVDYGLWLDWERAFVASDVEPAEAPLPAAGLDLLERRAALDTLTVKAATLDRSKLTCRSCHSVFAAEARSYQLKGLCPECFEPAD